MWNDAAITPMSQRPSSSTYWTNPYASASTLPLGPVPAEWTNDCQMIICNSCGTPLSDALAFCRECGAAAPNKDPTILAREASSIALSVPVITHDCSGISTQPIGGDNAQALGNSPPKTATPKIALLVIGGTIIAVIATIAILASRSHSSATSPDSVAASLHMAIQSGRLVTLSNDDAY